MKIILLSKKYRNKNYPYPISISPRDSYEQHFGGFGHFDRAPGSSIIKREIFVKENGFLIPKYAGDTELWFRLAQKYELVLFPRDLVWDRSHSQTQSSLERLDKNIVKFRREVSNFRMSLFFDSSDYVNTVNNSRPT